MCKRFELDIDRTVGKLLDAKLDGYQKGKMAEEGLDEMARLLGTPRIVEETAEYHKPYAVNVEKQGGSIDGSY
jgi:hypothetical protein